MSVTPTVLPGLSGWVTLTWSGISDPSVNDWIGVYSPSNVNLSQTAPVKYQYANYSSGYLSSGQGEFQMQLLNMHSDYIMVFFRNGTESPMACAWSNSVTFANLEEPMQGHLMLTEQNVGEIRLSWTTGYTPSSQYVKWGSQSGVYTWTQGANTTTYDAQDMCQPPATTVGWRAPGYLNTALMTNLEPEVQYFYVYGSDEYGWSQQSSFFAPPYISPQRGVNMIVYGDMGQAETDSTQEHDEQVPAITTTNNIIDYMSKNKLDLILHIGDIAYAIGYSSEWDQFMYQLLPVFSRVPYMTCGGNHEYDAPNSTSYFNGSDSGGECGVPYEARFPPLPIPSEGTGANHWYSFDYGNVHVIMISTEHNFMVGSDQYNFIYNDLKNVDRYVTPWVILGGHRPMYIDSAWDVGYDSDQTVAEQLRENLEPLLVKYYVNLALWGHHHSYQRTCHVANQTCGDPSLPVHVVIGMAGKSLSTNLEPETPSWIEVVDDTEYGYSTIQTTETTLTMSFYNNDNVLKDVFQLKQAF